MKLCHLQTWPTMEPLSFHYSEKLKYQKKNLSQCHFVHYKSEMHYIWNETKSPYSENGEKSLELKHSQLCYYMKLQSNITFFLENGCFQI
jgi:hypothetical protein